jgi:hypothetical protein
MSRIWPLVLAIAAVAAPAAAQSEPAPDAAPRPLEIVRIDRGVIRVEAAQSAEDSGASARRVPGFEMRGFEGDVKQDSDSHAVVGLGLATEGGPGTGAPLRIKVELYNLSDDLIAVLAFEPAVGTGGLPWRHDLGMPLELDWEEHATVLAAAPEVFFTHPVMTLEARLEDGSTQRWTIHAQAQ